MNIKEYIEYRKTNPFIFTPKIRRKLSEANKKRIANGTHHFWKGGITAKNIMLRRGIEYKLWREEIFKRDNYQCVLGGKEHGNRLNADHIKSFAHFPELGFVVSNGRTLCESCHRKTDTFAGKSYHKPLHAWISLQ